MNGRVCEHGMSSVAHAPSPYVHGLLLHGNKLKSDAVWICRHLPAVDTVAVT